MIVQKHLGHSIIQMTLNLYSHVSESLGKQAAKARRRRKVEAGQLELSAGSGD